MKTLKFIVEKHRDCYVAYPLGLKGVVVGEGDTYETALADAKSAASCYASHVLQSEKTYPLEKA